MADGTRKQSFRFEIRSSLATPLINHILAVDRPDTAADREGTPPAVLVGPGGVQILMDGARKHLASVEQDLDVLLREQARRPGPKSSGIVELHVGGLDWDRDRDGKPIYSQKIANYTGDVYRFFEKNLGPESRIATAAVHLDEVAPHVHILAVCANAERRLGWTNVSHMVAGVEALPKRDRRGRRRGGLPGARGGKGSPPHFSSITTQIHVRLYKEVSQFYGIAPPDLSRPYQERTRHKPIDRSKAFPARLKEERQIGQSEGRRAGLKEGRREGQREQLARDQPVVQKHYDAEQAALAARDDARHEAQQAKEQVDELQDRLRAEQSARERAQVDRQKFNAVERQRREAIREKNEIGLTVSQLRRDLAEAKQWAKAEADERKRLDWELAQLRAEREAPARPVAATPVVVVPSPPKPVDKRNVPLIGAPPGTAAAAATGRKPAAAKQPAPPPGGRRVLPMPAETPGLKQARRPKAAPPTAPVLSPPRPQPAPERPVGPGGANRPAAPGVTRAAGQHRGPVPAPERPPGPGSGWR